MVYSLFKDTGIGTVGAKVTNGQFYIVPELLTKVIRLGFFVKIENLIRRRVIVVRESFQFEDQVEIGFVKVIEIRSLSLGEGKK